MVDQKQTLAKKRHASAMSGNALTIIFCPVTACLTLIDRYASSPYQNI
jgi:hypothetical protein